MTLLYMAIGWAGGIYFASRVAPAGAWWPTPAFIGLLLAVLLRRDMLIRQAGLCLLAAGLGMWRYDAVQPRFTAADLATYNDQGTAVLTGVIVDAPDVRDRNVRLRVAVDSIRQGSGPVRQVSGLALVYADRAGRYAYGDRLRVYGFVQTPPEFDTFSFRDYLARGGVHTVVFQASVRVTGQGHGEPLRAVLLNLRAEARALIQRVLPEPESSLLAGILLGDESGIAPDVRTAFAQTNTTHLIAISGANVAVLTALLMGIAGRLLGRWPAALITIAGIGLYAIFVGGMPSVVRAAIMAVLTIVALRFGRRYDALTALAASAWFMTLLNPMALFDLGLILSVAATLGLIVYLGPMTRLAEAVIARLFARRTARAVAGVLADTTLITLSAQITTLPIILLIANEFSPVSLPVNILVAPAQPWIMTLGLLTVAAGTIWFPVGQIAAWLVMVPLAYTLGVIRALAGPGLPVLIEPNTVLAYYVLLFGATFILVQPPERRRAWLARIHVSTAPIALCGLAVAGLVWAMVLSRPDGLLRVWFLEVGEGAAMLIQTPGGAHILVDGGENPTRLLTALGDRLPFFKRRLDLALLTAPRPVIAAAMPTVADRYAIGALLTNGQESDVHARLAAAGVPLTPVSAGYRAETDDGVVIEVLAPVTAPDAAAPADDYPLILRLRYGNATFLLTSEISERGIQALLTTPGAADRDYRAVVLHLASNGVARSNPPAWLELVAPQVAIITAEAGNRAALPAPEVLRALEAIPVYRTDQHGTVEIATDGRLLWVSARR